MEELSNIKYKATQLEWCRSERWEIVFEDKIPDDATLTKLCHRISYLWQDSIRKNPETKTVYYSGWID